MYNGVGGIFLPNLLHIKTICHANKSLLKCMREVVRCPPNNK